MKKAFKVTEKMNNSYFEIIHGTKSVALGQLKDWTRNMDQNGVDWDCKVLDQKNGDKNRRYVAPNGDYIEIEEVLDRVEV